MLVAVVAVPVVQTPSMYEVTRVTMRDTLILVRLVIPGARTLRAFCRILTADRELMLVVVVSVLRMKMSVMKVICMPFVTNGSVSAVRTMCMRMTLMCLAAHVSLLSGLMNALCKKISTAAFKLKVSVWTRETAC